MTSIEKLFQNAIAALNSGQFENAERLFKTLLKSQRNHVGALNLLTVVLMHMGRFAEAEDFIERAVKIDQTSDVSFYNFGTILKQLGKPREALRQFDNALRLNAKVADTWNSRGSIFNDLKQYEKAISDFDQAIVLDHNYFGAFYNKGKSLSELRRYDDALAAYDRALALKLDFAEAWLGRGSVLSEIKRYDEAIAAYDKALALKPNLAEAWYSRGNLFSELKNYDEAFAAYNKAFVLAPDLSDLEGARLHAKMHLGDWRNFDTDCERLIASIRNNKDNSFPFPLLGIPCSAEDQKRCAELWVAKNAPASEAPIWQGEQYQHDRVRLAYVSADFGVHPVSYLMADVFERHDRERFETIGVSSGPDDGSELRGRLKAAFDQFIDVENKNDIEIAQLLRSLEVDIAIDLTGHTKGCRAGVFAQRPVPIQVNYLGYAGTMGARYFDYLIADATLVPSAQQMHYSEKLAYLPHSFMPNAELSRVISDRSFDRAQFGLPEEGFVFCCFNNVYKFNPHVFEVWVSILKKVDGSVLWLSEANATAVENLRKQAAASGLDPNRLLFARRLSSTADHLARHCLADLFLDTLPYNAHTTASDALWAGLPVLTRIGETFAGRVAASLLTAIGLPELVTSTMQAYEDLAIELATNPSRLADIRHKLVNNRLTTPLFDTDRFTRHIEAAYTAMYGRYRANLAPDVIYVPQ